MATLSLPHRFTLREEIFDVDLGPDGQWEVVVSCPLTELGQPTDHGGGTVFKLEGLNRLQPNSGIIIRTPACNETDELEGPQEPCTLAHYCTSDTFYELRLKAVSGFDAII